LLGEGPFPFLGCSRALFPSRTTAGSGCQENLALAFEHLRANYLLLSDKNLLRHRQKLKGKPKKNGPLPQRNRRMNSTRIKLWLSKTFMRI
jgi:hypothetical protein